MYYGSPPNPNPPNPKPPRGLAVGGVPPPSLTTESQNMRSVENSRLIGGGALCCDCFSQTDRHYAASHLPHLPALPSRATTLGKRQGGQQLKIHTHSACSLPHRACATSGAVPHQHCLAMPRQTLRTPITWNVHKKKGCAVLKSPSQERTQRTYRCAISTAKRY